MDERKIKDIYGESELDDVNFSLVKWHNEVINKSVGELTYADVARMLRQGEYMDIAMDRAIAILKADPYAGELYTGELLSSLLEADKELLKKRKPELNLIVSEAIKDSNSVTWGYPEEKDEYMDLIRKLESEIDE
ncbi:MAG: hypothetical protein IJL07_08165 [Lachnospiraceae bacterium]|nr:hypothetical protein [Lachnospiraceae bacterium]MBR5368369.1 hypothetical protein [Lachnospiraceae bacterium]